MIIIPKDSTFLNKGAIVLDDEELEIIIHALESDRVVRSWGKHCGKMIEEVNVLLGELKKYKIERGA